MPPGIDAADSRIAITGVGLVTPLGRTPEEIWERWRSGRSAAAPLTRFDARTLRVRIGCEVPAFDPRKEVRNRKLLRLMIGGEDFGYRAATDALAQAGVDTQPIDPDRCGLAIASHKEGFRHQNLYEALEVSLGKDGRLDRQRFLTDGWTHVPPQIIIEALPNAGLYYIAHDHGLRGVNCNLLSVGTGGLLALSEAMHAVADAEADVMLAGSFDTWLNWMCIGHNVFTGLLSESQREPRTVHRPFDVERTGSVPGEGAGMFIVEQLGHARRRGAAVLGEILGAASAVGVPSYDDTAAADALAHCLSAALASAGCTPEDIDLIQLHGDATPRGDWIEARGIRSAFGEHARRIPATTIKSATGLMGNASGPVETAMALEALRRGEILPIMNLSAPDPELELNLVTRPISGLNLRRAVVVQRAWPSLSAALVVSRGS